MKSNDEHYCTEMQLYGQFASIRARAYLERGCIHQATKAQDEACNHYRDARRRLYLIINDGHWLPYWLSLADKVQS